MSAHSYSRCRLHLVWGTLRRESVLSREAAVQVSQYLDEYAKLKRIYMKVNYVNADHVHALVDLPTGLSIEATVQLLKGNTSHWINSRALIGGKFAWGRGYGAFSVSESAVERVARYIAGQEQHHRKRTFADDLNEFVERYGLEWRDEKAVKTARGPSPVLPPG